MHTTSVSSWRRRRAVGHASSSPLPFQASVLWELHAAIITRKIYATFYFRRQPSTLKVINKEITVL